jgi:hypothetical protein
MEGWKDGRMEGWEVGGQVKSRRSQMPNSKPWRVNWREDCFEDEHDDEDEYDFEETLLRAANGEPRTANGKRNRDRSNERLIRFRMGRGRGASPRRLSRTGLPARNRPARRSGPYPCRTVGSWRGVAGNSRNLLMPTDCLYGAPGRCEQRPSNSDGRMEEWKDGRAEEDLLGGSFAANDAGVRFF